MAFGMAGLEYVLKLNDQITGPIKGIMQQMDTLASRGKAAMGNIAAGAAGIVATGYSIASAFQPALDAQRALGEVKSLGVAEKALDQLKDKALSFTSSFGGASADFIRSAYDIQSAIAGLSGSELSAFTEASNLLAKGTKSTAATITNYMGTMYGIFADEADKMGKSNWVNKIAGQTALAVKMFKTTGDGMSGAFTAVGAAAKSAGIEAAEQFAVLGSLQATMSGSEAGTKYKAFLAGVGKAQEKLGLKFTDNNGRMLDMVTILQRIRDKYGDLSETAASDLIGSAFGSDQATSLIKLLIPQISNLKGNIKDLRNVSDTAELTKMAQAMTDPWQRFGAILEGIKIAIGGEVLKKINNLANKIADAGKYFVDWLNANKYISRLIGYIGVGLMSLAGAGASLMLLVGTFKLIGVGATAALLPMLKLGKGVETVGKGGSGIKAFVKSLAAPIQPIKFIMKWVTVLKGVFASAFGGAMSLVAGLRWRLAILPTLLKSMASKGTLLQGVFAGFKSILTLILNPLSAVKSLFLSVFNIAFRLLNPFTYLRLAMMALFSPISLITIAIAGIALLVYKFRSQLSSLWEGIKVGFGSISERLQPLFNAFAIFKTAISKIVDIFARITGGANASSAAAGKFFEIGMVIGNILGTGLEIVAGFIELLATQFLNIVELFSNVADSLMTMWDGVVTGWKNSDPKQIFGALANGMSNIFKDVINGIYKMFMDSLNWIIRQVNKVGDFVGVKFNEFEVSNVFETNHNVQLEDSVKPNAQPQINSQTQGLITTAMTQNKAINNSMVIQKVEVKAEDPQALGQAMRRQQDYQMLGMGHGS
ncbi:phage tail tape measure protein [Gallibacterium sp. AGMB14963]|uniref:phage tail tape measure protein n=1 Tax=Gallibacterium faecale TaxID=3019086 RepID=UPI0022F160E7|nr:phage tail tape measure protein [Gallibacterium sp. AGMB14963]MDA3979044.1 phage tail tape measure protein [Gallibacterium sp. AGMB14963]